MIKSRPTLESIHRQTEGSADTYDSQSEIAKIMDHYYQTMDVISNRIAQKSNQRHPNLAEEPKHVADGDNRELEEIINESEDREQHTTLTLDELFKKFELEYSNLNKAIDDLRKEAALIRNIGLTC